MVTLYWQLSDGCHTHNGIPRRPSTNLLSTITVRNTMADDSEDNADDARAKCKKCHRRSSNAKDQRVYRFTALGRKSRTSKSQKIRDVLSGINVVVASRIWVSRFYPHGQQILLKIVMVKKQSEISMFNLSQNMHGRERRRKCYKFNGRDLN